MPKIDEIFRSKLLNLQVQPPTWDNINSKIKNMKVEFKYPNGIEVKDTVSGFTGIIDCCALWLNGCVRYSVQPKMKKGEVKKPDSIWIDEETLIKVSDGVNEKVKPSKTGGPSFSSEGAKF